MSSDKICKFEQKLIALTFVIAAQVKHNIVVAAYLKLLESISFILKIHQFFQHNFFELHTTKYRFKYIHSFS
jgi:hypothetical protein